MTSRPGLVVLTPIAPATTGNGLAMRVESLIAAADLRFDVHLVVVPVAGTPPAVSDTSRFASLTELAPIGPQHEHPLAGWLTDPVWRARLAVLEPIPPMVACVPLDVVAEVAQTIARRQIAGVLAIRLTTAALGLRLAEAFEVPLALDLDDDDEELASQIGDRDAAAAWNRLAAWILPHTTGAFGASSSVAGAITTRHGLSRALLAVPNAAPPGPARHQPRPRDARALMVANFSYRPNADGARWFVDEVLPLLPETWSVDLVGPGGDQLDLGDDPRVRAVGFVDDLAPWYGRSAVVIAPLLSGSGTRTKILEAFTHRRPVVATSVAIDGLGLTARREALVADAPAAFARAMDDGLDDALAASLVVAADRLVASTYDREVVLGHAASVLADAFSPVERDHIHEEPTP